MIAGLKPYPSYKDSGVSWLGEMPVSWEVRRNGRLFVQRNETGFPDLPILEVSLRTGVRVRDFAASARKQVMADRAKYKRAFHGDIAYNMMRMWQGAVGVAPVDGLVSPAYVVARPLPGTSPEYYSHLFRTDAYMGEVDNYSRGIVKDRNRLYWEQFKQIPTPYPSPDEQANIVRFLKHAGHRIRRYIRGKQTLIKLLEEQKQAIIHRAVTRGLDPNVRFKSSGVEWLGDVPEHWELRRLKTVCSMRSGDGITRMSIEHTGEYPVYGGNGIRGFTSRYTHDGDFVLVGRQGALCGNVHVARGQFWASEHAVVTTLRHGHHLEWLAALLRTMNLNQYSIAAAQPGLAVERVLNLWVPVPPRLEQDRLAAHIGSEVAKLAIVGARAHREIDLLREYRTRLIADVVTGKLDVRESAASLPDEPEGQDPLEDIESEEESPEDLEEESEEEVA